MGAEATFIFASALATLSFATARVSMTGAGDGGGAWRAESMKPGLIGRCCAVPLTALDSSTFALSATGGTECSGAVATASSRLAAHAARTAAAISSEPRLTTRLTTTRLMAPFMVIAPHRRGLRHWRYERGRGANRVKRNSGLRFAVRGLARTGARAWVLTNREPPTANRLRQAPRATRRACCPSAASHSDSDPPGRPRSPLPRLPDACAAAHTRRCPAEMRCDRWR